MRILSKSAIMKNQLQKAVFIKSGLFSSAANGAKDREARKEIPVDETKPPPEDDQAEGRPWSEVWTNEEGTQKSGGQLIKEQLHDVQQAVKESAKNVTEATKDAVSRGAAQLQHAGSRLMRGTYEEKDAKESPDANDTNPAIKIAKEAGKKGKELVENSKFIENKSQDNGQKSDKSEK